MQRRIKLSTRDTTVGRLLSPGACLNIMTVKNCSSFIYSFLGVLGDVVYDRHETAKIKC
jgi:hypothetical protein